MAFIPITRAEARGRGMAASIEFLALLAERGERFLSEATAPRPRPVALPFDVIRAAYEATREPWGGVTIDLTAGQIVSRTDGYAVTTKSVHMRRPADDRCLSSFANDLLCAAQCAPVGQYLGVFHDADEHAVDIDSVYVTGNKARAYCVAVARHSVGGIYDFATGDGVWPPYLRNS